MRLTLSALLCTALFASPALAGDRHPGSMIPPPGADRTHSPDYGAPYAGGQYGGGPYSEGQYSDGPDHEGRYHGDAYRDGPHDPRWGPSHPPMSGEWMERCRQHPGTPGDHAYAKGCGYAGGYGYPGAHYPGAYYPGAYAGYAVPMIMVPVLRSKPCPEVVEEIIEEVVVPARSRVIRPQPRAVPDKRVPVADKRVPISDKRVNVAPAKRIAY